MRKRNIKILILSSILILSLSACRTSKNLETVKQVPVPVTIYKSKTDTITKIVNHHDSIFELDSVYIRGNTVYKSKYHNKYIIQHDTISKTQIKTDTITKPVMITNTNTVTQKYIPKIYKISMTAMCIFILLLILYITYKICKKYKKI